MSLSEDNLKVSDESTDSTPIKPFAIDIIGKSDDDMKVVLDVSELGERSLFYTPIVISTTKEQNLNVKFESDWKELAQVKCPSCK